MNSRGFILASRRSVTQAGVRDAGIVIEGDRIMALAEPGEFPDGYFVEDLGELVVMPGIVDSHVHMNEPGRTEWEGAETATMAAAAGGITTLVDMPLNCSPVTTTAGALELKRTALADHLYVDCGLYGGLVPGSQRSLGSLIESGVIGIKAFLVDSGIEEFPAVGRSVLSPAMSQLAEHGIPLLVHAELQTKTEAGAGNLGRTAAEAAAPSRSYPNYLASRPDSWEVQAIELMIELCRESGCPTHIVHLSSAEAIPALRRARDSGLPISVETCPHYLFFCAEEIGAGDTRFKCAPPIRGADNRERLWEALREGVIDLVASDHSPSPRELKLVERGDFQGAWGGISSLQLSLPVLWTTARRRGCSLQDLVSWMSRVPAQLVGLSDRKGALAVGYQADLVVWDPETNFAVSESLLYHCHKLSPYVGERLYGRVERTYLAGQEIYARDRGFADPRGKLLVRCGG